MLGPEDFIVIVGVMCGLAAAGVLLAGWLNRRQSGTLPKAKARRDRIADGTIKPHELDAMLAAENARLRARGKRELSRQELESRVVGDDTFRRRLMLLRHRRHPERARRLA